MGLLTTCLPSASADWLENEELPVGTLP